MNKSKFAVGDKVVLNYRKVLNPTIGTVIRVTDKRKDVVVDFDGFQQTFDCYGRSKSDDIWYFSYIELLTPAMEQDIEDNLVIAKCKKMMKDTILINADQTARIIAILEEEHNENQY